MSAPRYIGSAGHKDGNHDDIVRVLQQAGYTTQDLSAVGLGCPDLLVGFAGCNILLEIKNRDGKATGSRAEGNENQKKWKSFWRGQTAVVFTAEEALEVCSAVLAREKLGR